MTERRLLRALHLSLLTALSAACGGQIDVATEGDADVQPDGDRIDSGPKVCATTGKPDGGASCGWSVTFVGDPALCALPTDGGSIPPALCNALCGESANNQPTNNCYWDPVNSPTHLQCGLGCMGRKPGGLRSGTITRGAALADYFAHMAFLESASIDAFYILHDELEAHGAPVTLLHSALVAADDEVRHARAASIVARRFGGDVTPPVVERGPARSLLALALENAVEGCVHETWGALLAAYQAEHAEASLRGMFRVIAKDEAQHALLGHRVGSWAERHLSATERAQVESARAAAIEALLASLATEPDAELVRVAGVPRSAQALVMARSLFAQLESLAA